ncbi:MAG: glycosyltransferase family 2 protein [Nitrospirae bacterium]|nr:glycosyltransferase family 2 protein [Nitrospirota bacterium]
MTESTSSSLKEHVPRVSVIIPTYNRAPLLREAISSVLCQTYDDFELIIVDDGSTDNTHDVIDEFSSPKIRYFYHCNQGRSRARNWALGEARGEFIAFLDSDDMFMPNKLQKQVAFFDNNSEFGMLYSSARVIDDNGNEIFNPGDWNGTKPYYLATDSGWLYPNIAFCPRTVVLPTVMVRKEVMVVVGGFDEKMHRFEDTDMWRRISKVFKICAISEPLCIIRTHAGNKMESTDRVYASIHYYVTKIFREDRVSPFYFKHLGASKLYLHYALAIFENNGLNRSESARFFLQSFRYCPPYFLAHTIYSCIRRLKRML